MSSSARIVLPLLWIAALSCGKPGSPALSPTNDPRILEARRLMAEAGFPDGRGFPKLTFTYNTLEAHKKVAAAAQEMWRQALGIEIELRNVEWTVLMGMRDRGEFDILRSGYTGEYADPHSLLSLFRSDSGFNTGGYRSETFDRLLEESNLVADPAKRWGALARAEQQLLDDLPLLPIYHYLAWNVTKPFVKGVHPNVRDLHPVQAVSLEGEGRPADGVLVMNGEAEPQSLDPAISHDIAGLKVLMHLFEGLVSYDPVDAQPIPGAAERWEVSEDGRTYTFRLRPARWSNGDPVTAHDFVHSWRRVVDPKTASYYSHRLYEIEGAREAVESGDSSKLAVNAPDERTFVVRLRQRTPYFLQLICLNLFYPVHRATVEKHGKDWTKPEHLVGNGAYRMTERRFKERKVLEKSATYWNAAAVKQEKFVILSVEDSDTAFRMYEAGQIHWLFRVPLTFADTVRERPDVTRNPYNGTYFYLLNLKRKPLDDLRVRRALNLALDVKGICEFVLRGGEPPATRLTPPLYPDYKIDLR